MARQDIMLAQQEFFAGGGEAGSMPTIAPKTYRYPVTQAITDAYGYRTVYIGMPMALPLSDCPALLLFMPQSREGRSPPGGRPGANKKFIAYTCDVRLACAVQGDPQSLSVASDALWQFYGWCDAINQMIRGGPAGLSSAKSLITPSYPTGGDVIVWGENSTFQESLVAMQTAVLLTGRFLIDAAEEVTA